jgi:trk system potassium uptake protein TrkH
MQFERIGYVAGVLMMVTAIFMIAPMTVDIVSGNRDWQSFAHALGIVGVFAGLLILVTRDHWKSDTLTLREAFITTSFSWLVVPLAGCLPFYFMADKLPFVDAWFEAVSGMTTTGSTVLVNLDNEPPGILLWRSLLQWIGGVGIILMAMLILPFLRVGGMQIFRTESSDRSEKVLTREAELIPRIAIAFVVLTIACMVGYLLAGMTTFDALNHALTTISTGGFSTHDDSLAHYQQPAVHWVAAAFMFAASLPIILYIKSWQHNGLDIFRDVQVRGFFKICAFAILVVTVYLAASGTHDLFDALRFSTVNVLSIISTTGYALGDFTSWGHGASGLFLVLMFLGGCTGSTAGAIKTYRLQAMALITRRYVDQLFSPRRVINLRYGNRSIDEDIILSILAFLTAFAGSVILVTVLLTLFDLDPLTAFSAAVTSLTNVGPGLGNTIGPSGTFAPLPEGAKLVLIFAMILGRLEFFALLVLFSPRFWR